ncbi:MAG TPA: lytic transglycosylase domain-containing protein [Thermoanaerobaculia bacterium]
MERKREAPAVVAMIFLFRRLCRSSRPLCFGALPLCLAHLTAPPAQPVRPPLLAAATETVKPEVQETSPGSAGVPPALTARLPEPDSRRDAGAPRTPVDSLEAIHRATDLLIEVNTAFGVPRSPYGQLIYDVALRHSINPHLVAAMIHVESAFNPRAVSRKGACGLMQLLPDTARRFGLRKKKDLFDPKKNLQAGVRYLQWLTERFGGDVEKILAAYNAGEGAVERFGGIPPYRETQEYVERIFGLLGFTPEPPVARGGGTSGIVAAGR